MRKIVKICAAYAAQQARAGAAALQVFDSWAGCLAPEDYREYVLPYVTDLIGALQTEKVPVIYFGTDTATLLSAMRETAADVIGVDWRRYGGCDVSNLVRKRGSAEAARSGKVQEETREKRSLP